MKKLNKKGFTLIELIVVIAILAILALILIPSITGYISKANSSKNEANARAAYSSAVLIASTWDSSTTISEGAVVAAVQAQIAGLADAGALTVALDTVTGAVTNITFTPKNSSTILIYPKS